jgi:hypothetical protein
MAFQTIEFIPTAPSGLAMRATYLNNSIIADLNTNFTEAETRLSTLEESSEILMLGGRI